MEPTLEQQKIIHHVKGHALVFAVAGSGKTTTMISRILYLIREENVRPLRILVCTFSREAVRTIEERLSRYPETKGVKVATLHSLAFDIIREATRMGFTEIRQGEQHFSYRLYYDARNQLIKEDEENRKDYFDIKYQDFQTYMSVQKGNLWLPYIPNDLPVEEKKKIGMPDYGIDLYFKLYERHDKLRRAVGKIDFDDTIVQAWMLMARFPDLQQVMNSKWDYINVDEFQDINKAQSEMLHLLIRECDSYFAIGDDDQTIYQWRGAHPQFILDFPKRYGAKRYTLSTNFRCPMGVIALANQVIQENSFREKKYLRASQGSNGVFIHDERPGQAAHIAIQAIEEEKKSPKDIVILVRTYAQTAQIEQVFLEKEIPYAIIGSLPFYHRREVKVLLAYLRLAIADFETKRSISMDLERRKKLMDDWIQVANQPSRYLRKSLIPEFTRGIWQRKRTLVQALEEKIPSLKDGARQKVKSLVDALSELIQELGMSEGKEALLEFSDAIEYPDYLIKTSPTREFGEERAGSIRALAEMARERSLGDLITYIDGLDSQGQHASSLENVDHSQGGRVVMMTAFRAKGLEWPVVIIPDCNSNFYRIKKDSDKAAAEEERRIFYVGMTRARKELHLIVDEGDPTDFLYNINYKDVVYDHECIVEVLEKNPNMWSGRDTFDVGVLLKKYHHEQYVQAWMKPDELRSRLFGRMERLRNILEERDELYINSSIAPKLSLESYEEYGELEVSKRDNLVKFDDIDDIDDLIEGFLKEDEKGLQYKNLSEDVILEPFQIEEGMLVKHEKLGCGRVLSVHGCDDKMQAEIQFEKRVNPQRMHIIFSNLFPVVE